jgi:serine/threonine protein kinase
VEDTSDRSCADNPPASSPLDAEIRVSECAALPRIQAQLQAALGSAFTLECALSGGGMNPVFLGTETALRRRIVLKVLSPDEATEEQAAQFRQEAVLAARLVHPHIVPIFAVGSVAGFLYYTMPFIDGESLRDRLDRASGLPVDAAIRVIREIGSALAFAHTNGVVHRDVKPENIFIEHATGRALLADFGIAWGRGEPDWLALPGTTLGTPMYMSPEQVDGLELDGRSDLYSLGLVAWEMLAGELPWIEESMYTVMYRQKHDALPPLCQHTIGVPQVIVDAIERCLIKDREARWESADALVSAVGERPEPPTPSSRSRRRGTGQHNASADASANASVGSALAHAETADADVATTVAISVARGRLAQRREARYPNTAVATPMVDNAVVTRSSTPVLGRRESTRRSTVGRIRWLIAACGAAIVIAGVVGAATFGHSIVQRIMTEGGVVAPIASAAAPAVTALQPDTVSGRITAADYTQIRGDTSVIAEQGDTSSSAPFLPTTTIAHSRPRPHIVSLTHVNRARRRAASATLALRARRSGAAPVSTPAPRRSTSAGVQSYAVAVTPRTAASPESTAAQIGNPQPSADGSVSPPPAGSRVWVQAVQPSDAGVSVRGAPQPAVTTMALAVRVPHLTNDAHGKAPPGCDPRFPGSRICRVFNPATGRIETWYMGLALAAKTND